MGKIDDTVAQFREEHVNMLAIVLSIGMFGGLMLAAGFAAGLAVGCVL